MHIQQTVLFTFPQVPRRRICLRVMTLISDSGLILYGETSSSFYLLHLKLLVFSPNLSTTSGGKSLVAKALLMILENSCLQKNKMTENTCIHRCQVEGKQNKLSSSILQEISVDYKQHVPLDSKDLNTNSLYCLPDIFYYSSSEKLVSNPTILPNRRFFFLSSHQPSAWQCGDMVRGNELQVTPEVRGLQPHCVCNRSQYGCMQLDILFGTS